MKWSAWHILHNNEIQAYTDEKTATGRSRDSSLMRRWTYHVLKRHSQCLKPADFLLSRTSHHLASIDRVLKKEWHHQGLQRSRIYTEESLMSSVSQKNPGASCQPDLTSAGVSNDEFRDLLSDGARYFIHDLETLDFESSVNSKKGRGIRLVECPKYQFDFELWSILLRYQMRAYGDAGIKSIWSFITRRDRLRMLPNNWPMEDSLWSIFVRLGLKDHDFLKRIGKHAKQLWLQRKLRRSSLYIEAVGGLLKSEDSAAAPIFSKIMHPGAPISSEELIQLFLQACWSANPRALMHFRSICDSIPCHKIYGSIVSILCEQERLVEAMTMHGYLIGRHDCPTTFEEIEPLVRLIARDDLDLSDFTRQLEGANVSFSGRAERLYDSAKKTKFGISREDIDLATNRTFGVGDRRLATHSRQGSSPPSPFLSNLPSTGFI